MGQKVHPGGFRVGVIHDWKSHWYTEKEFKQFLAEDEKIRLHILGKLSHAGLSRIIIRKDQNNITIDIHTARPGIVIGKSGSEVDALRKEIHGDDQEERPGQHHRGQASGARRRAGGPVHRRAAREPRQLPPRHEARPHERHAFGRRRHARALRRPSGRRRDGPQRALQRRPRAAAHAARGHRLRLPRGPHHLRPHRREGLDQQGRDPARGLPDGRGQGAHGARRAAPRRPRWSRPPSAPRRRPRRSRSRWSGRGPGGPGRGPGGPGRGPGGPGRGPGGPGRGPGGQNRGPGGQRPSVGPKAPMGRQAPNRSAKPADAPKPETKPDAPKTEQS